MVHSSTIDEQKKEYIYVPETIKPFIGQGR